MCLAGGGGARNASDTELQCGCLGWAALRCQPGPEGLDEPADRVPASKPQLLPRRCGPGKLRSRHRAQTRLSLQRPQVETCAVGVAGSLTARRSAAKFSRALSRTRDRWLCQRGSHPAAQERKAWGSHDWVLSEHEVGSRRGLTLWGGLELDTGVLGATKMSCVTWICPQRGSVYHPR